MRGLGENRKLLMPLLNDIFLCDDVGWLPSELGSMTCSSAVQTLMVDG